MVAPAAHVQVVVPPEVTVGDGGHVDVPVGL